MRVILADDDVLLREGVARLLADGGLDVIGQAGDGAELLDLVRRERPDVVVVDIRMPPTLTDEGLQAANEIRAEHPGIGVLVLSQHLERTYAMELLSDDTEGIGYLLKQRVWDLEEFVASVRRVGQGGSVLDPQVVAELVGRPRRNDPMDALTDAERETLALMAEGRSNTAIAEQLFVAERTVEKRVTNIFQKLDLPPSPDDHRRVLAVVTYLDR